MLFLLEETKFIHSLHCVMNIQDCYQDVPWSMKWQYPSKEKKKQYCSRRMLLTGCSLSWRHWHFLIRNIKKLYCTVAKIAICRRRYTSFGEVQNYLALCRMIMILKEKQSCSNKIMEMADELPFEMLLPLQNFQFNSCI